MRSALSVFAAILFAACTTPAAGPTPDPTIHVRLTNSGMEPLTCQLIFGHWVERDLGPLAPGADTGFNMQQQPKDGALYIMRDDGQRRMMIENLVCGRAGDWQRSRGEVDLASVRAQRPREIWARCALPAEGRTDCAPLVLKP